MVAGDSPPHRDFPETIGATLARLRLERSLTGVEVARRSGISQPQISKIENSKVVPSPADVRRLADAFELSKDDTADLLERARIATSAAARERSGRRGGPTMAVSQKDYLDEEDNARHLRQFEPVVVPGLLQTSEYARRMMNRYHSLAYGSDQRGWPDSAAAVEMRAKRQVRLYDTTKKFEFVLMESVLRHRFGGRSWPVLMAAQIQRLEEALELTNVSIRIIPADANLGFPPIEGFEILDDDVVLTESIVGGSRRDQQSVEFYARVFDRFRSNSTDDVLPILKRYRVEYLAEGTHMDEPDDGGPGGPDGAEEPLATEH